MSQRAQEENSEPSFLPAGASKGASFDQLDLLRKTARFLFVLVIGLSLFLVYNFVNFSGISGIPVDLSSNEKAAKVDDRPVLLPRSKPFEEYEEVFTTRDMFDMPYMNNSQPPKEEEDPTVIKGSLEQFELVGIMMDANPQVLLRHKVTKNIIFLSPGQEVEGAVLKEVNADGVIFSNQGKKILLELDEEPTPDSDDGPPI